MITHCPCRTHIAANNFHLELRAPIFSDMGCHRTTNPNFLLLYAIVVNVVVSVSLAVSLSRQHVDSPGYDTWLPKDNMQYAEDRDNHEQDLDEFNDDARELQTLKKAVIDGLGFKKIPDVTKMNVSQDEYVRMYDVYLKRLEQTQLSDSSHTQHLEPKLRIFRLKAERAKHKMGTTRLVFNISDNKLNALQHATLRLLATAADSSGPVRVQLYQVLKNKRRRLLEEKDVYLAAGAPKWCEFDVTSAVRSWLDRTERNVGVELHCVECSERGLRLLADSCNAEHCLPVITSLFRTSAENFNSINSYNNREKRSAEQTLYYKANRKTDCHQNNKRCCRHKMDFNLNELGLDFIIQPKIFDGGICKGRCPPRYNAAHNHAVLQGLMWKKNKNLIPRVCCSPSKLEYLEILMVDEDDPQKLTVKKWDNMVVQECACS